MVLAGVLLGLASAVVQMSSFFLLRKFVIRHKRAGLSMLVLSHVVMAVMSLAVVGGFWRPELIDNWRQYAGPLAGTAGFYLLGQAAVFLAMQWTEASRISPLLGLKVVVVAVLSWLLLPRSPSDLQWLAVAMSVLAAFILNYSGGRIALRSMAAILVGVLGYALSDWYTPPLVDALGGGFGGTVLGVAMMFISSAVVALPLLATVGPVNRVEFARALPFSILYFGAMMLFFGALVTGGVLLANIVLSSRGLMTIIVGALIAKLGHEHLERKLTGKVLARRTLAGAMMLLAIVIYSWQEHRLAAADAQVPGSPTTAPAQAAGDEVLP